MKKTERAWVLIAADRSLKVHRTSDLECYLEFVDCSYVYRQSQFSYLWLPLSVYVWSHCLLWTYYLPGRIFVSKVRVHMYGYFNLPGYDWEESGSFFLRNTNTRMKLLCTLDFVYFNGFKQRNNSRNCCGNIFYLPPVTSVVDISLTKVPQCRVDKRHLPFIVQFFFPLDKRIFHSRSWFYYSNGECHSLYQYLWDYDRSSVLDDQCWINSLHTFCYWTGNHEIVHTEDLF